MLAAVLSIGLVASLAAGGMFLVWLLRPTVEQGDGEDTIWLDVREWLMLDRLFGARPARLTYRPDEPPPGN